MALNKGTASAVRTCCLCLLLLVATIISLTASARSAINANAAWDFTSNDLYDFEDRLVTALRTAGTITMVYDGDGNRIRKTVSGTITHYLVDNRNPTGYAQVLEESTTLNGQPNVMYVYGLDLINQHRKVGAAWETDYYGYDGHGSVRFLTRESGVINERYSYDAFGNLLGSPGATPNKYLYAGEQWDPHLGMYYLRARYYHPELGRFWTKDTYEGHQNDPLSLHKYLFCAADPVNNTDPSGHFMEGIGCLFTATSLQTGLRGLQATSMTLPGHSFMKWAWLAGGIGAGVQTLMQDTQFAMDMQLMIQSNPTGWRHAYQIYKCDEFATNAMTYFQTKSRGKQPQRITYRSRSRRTVGDNIMAADGFGFFGGQNISIGGFHTGVLMDGRVYDNNVPFGVSRTKWEYGYMVTSLPEYQTDDRTRGKA